MVPEFKKKTIGRGAAFIYIETIASMISGYIFWIIMSKITTSETIGISSALVSFASIVAVIANIGIPTGLQRFIGKSFSEKKIDDAKTFVTVSLLLVCAGIAACSIIILIIQNWTHGIFGFDFNLIMVAILFIGSAAISMLFRSVVIASLKTKSLPIIMVTSSIVKLIAAIILLLLGTGALGLSIGFTSNHILSSTLLGIFVMRTIFKSSRANNLLIGFIHDCKSILLSSIVYWIPLLITTIGSQLGTIVVFGSQGPNQAGIYFLTLTIVIGLTSVMNSLFTIALPTLSGLRTSLEILLLSMLPLAVLSGINALVYSYGNYRHVLIIGLAVSIPRAILYFLLVPIYGGTGAALSYTVGSIIGCVVSIVIAKKIRMLIMWNDLAIIFIIPTTIAFTLSYLQLNFILGILATIVLSYVILLKIRVVTMSDVRDSMDVLPESFSNVLIKLMNKFKN